MFNTKRISKGLKPSKVLYHLTDIEREQLKRCLLDIMDDFVKVCNDHNLTYMLGGGSALGSIRHKGFIPWDDDLDIMMPRKDYDKFIKIYETELKDSYYLYVPNSKYEISNTFAKLVKKNTEMTDIYNVNTPYYKGIWIDIFPIENAPKLKVIRIIKGLTSDFLAFIIVSNYIYTFNNPIAESYFSETKTAKLNYKIRLITGFISSFWGYKKWYNFYDKFVQHKQQTNYFTIPSGRKHYLGEVINKEDVLPVEIGDFEGRKINLPANSKKYLTNLYGDYMKIPSVESRERHLFISFKIENLKSESEK